MHGLNWGWIALLAAAPPVVAIGVAWVGWRDQQIVLGNLAGTFVIFASAFATIMRERIEIDRYMQACADSAFACIVEPPPFTRFAVYAFVALVEVFAVFLWSLRVERHQRNRQYAPEWRR